MLFRSVPGNGKILDHWPLFCSSEALAEHFYSMSTNTSNRRILVVDDNEAIHKDFRKIFGTGTSTGAALEAAEALLFGEQNSSNGSGFEVDSAFQGKEGLEMVLKAVKEGRPYPLAFVDVRMPPVGTASRQ